MAAPEDALARTGSGGPPEPANLPASARGGGARNLGCGGNDGEGVRGGESSLGRGGDGRPATGLRDGGGAGGGPLRLDDVAPVFCGLSLGGPAAGGGGGGAGGVPLLLPGEVSVASATLSAACFCSTYALIKSAFCSIWSFVMPICNNSSSMPRQTGSSRSIPELIGRCGGSS